jgi:hypothetical protein
MMRFVKFVRIHLFMLALLSALVDASAQCDHNGTVIDLSANTGCALGIVIAGDSDTLTPVDNNWGLAAGQEISFSYSATSQSQSCLMGQVVELTCVQVLNSPPFFCPNNFSHHISWGAVPSVAFTPAVIDNSLYYFWDFGDGSTGATPTPSHAFLPGSYEICLTVSSNWCVPATSCQTVNVGSQTNCEASFDFTAADSLFLFSNNSVGAYAGCQWDLGNGEYILNQQQVEYAYPLEGLYQVCLTVWDYSGCVSQTCGYVFSGSAEELCNYTDCVFPGDANRDGEANVYDLLSIGVGYNKAGPERQALNSVPASIAWSPQFSPDWDFLTADGINYKHLDCNGDGIVNEFDVWAIESNYSPSDGVITAVAPGAPMYWLDFQWDTIVVDDNSPAYVEIEAALMAGNSQTPVNNLRGFALQLDYPEELVRENGVEADYFDNSILGGSNLILWMQQDHFLEGGILDLGFVKKQGLTSGNGKIADLKFIVISDVIGRSESYTPFKVQVKNVFAINPNGEMLTVQLPQEDATVIVVNKKTTATSENKLESRISIFPNPAKTELTVSFEKLQAHRLQVCNALGQQVFLQDLLFDKTTLNVSDWQPGIYWLKIHTTAGIANKHVVIEH